MANKQSPIYKHLQQIGTCFSNNIKTNAAPMPSITRMREDHHFIVVVNKWSAEKVATIWRHVDNETGIGGRRRGPWTHTHMQESLIALRNCTKPLSVSQIQTEILSVSKVWRPLLKLHERHATSWWIDRENRWWANQERKYVSRTQHVSRQWRKPTGKPKWERLLGDVIYNGARITLKRNPPTYHLYKSIKLKIVRIHHVCLFMYLQITIWTLSARSLLWNIDTRN